MKHLIKSIHLLLVLLLPTTALAHDFEVDGIYYNIIQSNEVAVTYEGTYFSSSYEYSGDVIIPATVNFDGITFSVTAIGEDAFDGCIELTSITIPTSVTYINEWAFYSCLGLTSITVENGNIYYDSRNNCNAIIETASNTLIIGCQNTIIPNSVTAIGYNAFNACFGLTSITIPYSVTYIGNIAFAACTGLTSVTIPNSVTYIDDEAFAYCSSLTSLTIPNSVTHIGYGAFLDCPADVYSYISDPTKVSMGENVFLSSGFGNDKERMLHVPHGTLGAYQADNKWCQYFDAIVEMESDTILASSIELDKTSAIMIEGETLQLSATILPETATNKTIMWSSSDNSIATVNDNGFVSAQAVGSATITAKTNDGSNLHASCTLTIKPQSTTINGDVNGDGKVTISDVTTLINLLLTNH